MIGVINYGAGNLGSVMNALLRLDADARFVENAADTGRFDRLIFPGDGHFAQTMTALHSAGYADMIRDWIMAEKPFLGICIGLQVLFEASEEAPGIPGLSVIKGRVKKFPCKKTPQIGWNETDCVKDSALFCETGAERASPFFYYIHSYYCVPDDGAVTAAAAEYYGTRYCAAIERGPLAAVQFHPEKSGEAGLRLLHSWLGRG
jgi:imidazole glycerol phosphate synthase glutamine amidotransferase subunit